MKLDWAQGVGVVGCFAAVVAVVVPCFFLFLFVYFRFWHVFALGSLFGLLLPGVAFVLASQFWVKALNSSAMMCQVLQMVHNMHSKQGMRSVPTNILMP